MVINKKLFDDTFLTSHEKLAIKSLQTLNDCKNFIFFQTWKDGVFNYVLFPITEIIEVDLNNKTTLKINMGFRDILLDKFKNHSVDWELSENKQSRVLVVIGTTIYYTPMNSKLKINKSIECDFFEISTFLNYN